MAAQVRMATPVVDRIPLSENCQKRRVVHRARGSTAPESTLRTCAGERARRMARVFLRRRSSGMYFFFAATSRSASRWLWLMTVSTQAMDLRTDLLHRSHRFEATLC